MTPIRRRVLTIAAAVLALTNLGAVSSAGAAECSANAAYQLICTIKDGPIVCVTEPCP